MISMGF